MSQRIVYWFRNDLRLQDNEGFSSAISKSDEVIPVFVFDPRLFANTKLGFRRASAMRAQFLIESVTTLKQELRAKGSDLIIKIGNPEKIIAGIAEQTKAQYVYTSKEIAPEETQIESSLSKNLKLHNVDIKLFWMHTVCSISMLPFSISQLPTSFQSFYEKLKPALVPFPLFSTPDTISPIPSEITSDRIPSLASLGIDSAELDNCSEIVEWKNGELAALAKFNDALVDDTKSARNSTKREVLIDQELSHWLSLGCISPKYMYQKAVEVSPDSDLLFDLLKRDYAQWMLLKNGPRFFKPTGINHDFTIQWVNDLTVFESWRTGTTSNTEVNSAMEQLNNTGHLTFHQRYLVANHLCNVLKINWTWGAMYLESQLLDYDVAFNWYNWNMVAGVSMDVLQ
jgi:deoxyribodipyrimidine photo-lyase